jgi:hypothetical protein
MLEIRGVHPVEAPEPVHLIDVAISGEFGEVEWIEITQENPDLPPDRWQVPWDERELPQLPDGRARAVFFFHYLDLEKPLMVSSEPVKVPAPTPLPPELRAVQYEEP